MSKRAYTSSRRWLLYRQLNSQFGESHALNSLGVVANSLDDLASGQKYLEQALQIKHVIGDRFGEGITLLNLGVLCKRAYKLETANEYFQQSLEICREIDDEEGVEAALIGLGDNYHSLGDFRNAQEVLERALEISRTIGDQQGEANILTSLGELYNEHDQPELGRKLCSQSVKITEEISAPSEGGYAWLITGRSLEQIGLTGEARQAYQRSLEIRMELGQTHLMVDSYAGLARTNMILGNRSQAVEFSNHVLEAIQSRSLDKLSQPVQACLTCYRILLPDQPELARKILRNGHEFILKVAGDIQNEGLRKSFLERVPDNVQLQVLIQNESNPGLPGSRG